MQNITLLVREKTVSHTGGLDRCYPHKLRPLRPSGHVAGIFDSLSGSLKPFFAFVMIFMNLYIFI
jgi:hypothetical protein